MLALPPHPPTNNNQPLHPFISSLPLACVSCFRVHPTRLGVSSPRCTVHSPVHSYGFGAFKSQHGEKHKMSLTVVQPDSVSGYFSSTWMQILAHCYMTPLNRPLEEADNPQTYKTVLIEMNNEGGHKKGGRPVRASGGWLGGSARIILMCPIAS